MIAFRNTLSQPTPQAYLDEIARERDRARGMTTDALQRAIMHPEGSSAPRHNAMHREYYARQPRLPDEPTPHVHLHDYEPVERP